MSGVLTVVGVDGDEALEEWRYVHNVVVPPAGTFSWGVRPCGPWPAVR